MKFYFSVYFLNICLLFVQRHIFVSCFPLKNLKLFLTKLTYLLTFSMNIFIIFFLKNSFHSSSDLHLSCVFLTILLWTKLSIRVFKLIANSNFVVNVRSTNELSKLSAIIQSNETKYSLNNYLLTHTHTVEIKLFFRQLL